MALAAVVAIAEEVILAAPEAPALKLSVSALASTTVTLFPAAAAEALTVDWKSLPTLSSAIEPAVELKTLAPSTLSAAD